MRYDNWDVIVFPRDSHVPIQEFKTACYVSQGEYGRQLPTMTCYIASLPASIPFRVSIHLWTLKAKPSALIESRRKPNQRVVYTTQVIVDGVRVFHELFEADRWPQEIAYEKRSIGNPKHSSSQRKQPLEFPPFHQNVLMQSSWDARENNGRIKFILSEQLISNSNKDILEQAGISWPIRNPLYRSPPSDVGPSTLQTPWLYTPSHNPLSGGQIESPLMTQYISPFARPSNPEPFARPKTDPPPQISHLRRPPVEGRGRIKVAPWDQTMTASLGNSLDDVSMDTWSTKQSTSTSNTDASMPDILFASPLSMRGRNSWRNPPKEFDRERSKHWEENRSSMRGGEKHMVVTLREDQFGQLVEALSPPKRGRDREPSSRPVDQDRSNSIQTSSQAYPPKMGPTGLPINTRPSAASLARTASYPDFHLYMRNLSNKLSPTRTDDNKGANEAQKSPDLYHPPFATGKENRVPTPFPFDTRIPTPYPFTHGISQLHSHGPGPRLSSWDSDVSMRDPSSHFSSLSRFEKGPQQFHSKGGKNSPASTPAASGNLKSRKEGLVIESPAPDNVRHDKSLLSTPRDPLPKENTKRLEKHHTIESQSSTGSLASNSNTETTPFVPGHRSGMESLDSMGRVERQLFSALGEELNTSFDNHDYNHGHDNSNTNPKVNAVMNDNASPTFFLEGLGDLGDSPVQKRKRKGSFGAERDSSPVMKMVREGLGDGGGVMDGEMDVDMPRLRGD
ncbi:hypothetical protein K505DRAFT_295483 [Melanomma pulvis-pyrius CBS 109.77]|uniref:Uncharacterized protein n=1 Tax=Melanomma pulvis-pyrius CBS 109.77 TaxID=1314802 RepID=A0A6A6XQX7_9PLEO|nr:hypothetical protein K505DRAFT_295483 [Melanomma pulvis-pyrius CBS 109.77]